MSRESVTDRIRKELERQRDRRAFTMHPTDTPDLVEIHGRVDLQALAEAVLYR